MDDYYYGKCRHIPAFGSWDCTNDDSPIPFTECFDSARQPQAARRYSFSEERDLYVAGDLYDNDHVVTPAVIVFPRHRGKKHQSHVKEATKRGWVECDMKEPPSPMPALPRQTPKPVDEDLYKISPELLHAKPRKKRGLGFFSICLLPTCVA